MTGNLRPSSRNIPAISRDSNQNLHLFSKTPPHDGRFVTRTVSPSLPPKSSSLKASSRLQPRAATMTTSSSILTTSSASVSSFIRSSNPSRLSTERIRPSMILRPSTPITTASSSRSSSNPTSRIISTTIPASRSASNGRAIPSLTKPSSLRPRLPTPLPEVSLEKPPNLRKMIRDGPISGSRTIPKARTDLKTPVTSKNLSPIVQRQPGKRRVTDAPKSTKVSNISDVKPQRAVMKPSESVKEKTGLGRSFSKSSLDMAIKHMDLRKGNGTRQFPMSIRSGASKIQPIHTENHSSSIYKNTQSSSNVKGANEGRLLAKLSDKDNHVYESMRYETLLLKEDVKNTNWLHSIDDRSLDHELELLPEPFGPL